MKKNAHLLNKNVIANLYANIAIACALNHRAHLYNAETSTLIEDSDLEVLEDEGIIYEHKTLGELASNLTGWLITNKVITF